MVVCRYLYVCEVCLALLGKGTSVTATQHRKWDTPFFAIDPVILFFTVLVLNVFKYVSMVQTAPPYRSPPSCALYSTWTLCLPLMYVL